jgi:CrcB protein
MTKEFIYLFIGGGLGSACRYAVQLVLHERIVPYHFPWSTLTVNLLGSFLIGVFYALSERFNLSPELRLFLTTGICGGFTTFSTFSNDGVALLKGGFYATFLLYAAVSIFVGIAAVVAGGWGVKTFLPPHCHIG